MIFSATRCLKILFRTILALTALFIVVLICSGIALSQIDLRKETERYASLVTGRKVMIGELHIGWDKDISVEVGNFRLGSPFWGTEADMASVARLNVVLDAPALWRGKILINKLVLDQPKIFLERDKDGTGNWKFKNKTTTPSLDPFTHESEDRAEFPAILDGLISNGSFRMKTTGGSMIRIDAGRLKIAAADEDSPVILNIEGAYNSTKAQMTAQGGSFAALRQASIPYPAKVKMVVGRDQMNFDGTLTDPVNADGIKGHAKIDAPFLDDIFAMVGLHVKSRFPFRAEGQFTRSGDSWIFENQRGHAAGSDFTGSLRLVEGARHEADAVTLDIAFKDISARPFIDGASPLKRKSRPSDIGLLSLQADRNPGVVADAKVRAQKIVYDDITLKDVEIHVQNKPGWISLDPLAFGIADGRAIISGRLDATGKLPRFNADIQFNNADLTRLLSFRRSSKHLLTGRLTAEAALDMQGNTVHTAIRNSNGGIVTFLKDGHVARSLIDDASMDIMAIFRDEKGWEPITCLIGIYGMRNGVGELMPLRLVTPELTFYGAGTVNLLTRQMDIVLQGDSQHTLALDLPIQLTGSFSNIDINPLIFGKGRDVDLAREAKIISALPLGLRTTARRNYCVR